MATVAGTETVGHAGDSRFFEISALLMGLILVAGFSLNLAMGRSTFASPLYVHAHGVIFFGWVVIYVLQTFLATRGPLALHRRLGWIAVGWVVAMIAAGLWVIVARTQSGLTPFFFQPQHFLIANPLALALFAALTTAAVARRRRTDWHRRLHLCAMAAILGPGFGRLIPMPLLIPWAFQVASALGLIFPLVGMMVDWRRTGRVHPAWLWGTGAIVGVMIATELLVYSPLGDAIFAWVTAGTPGANVAPLEFGPMPPMG